MTRKTKAKPKVGNIAGSDHDIRITVKQTRFLIPEVIKHFCAQLS